MRLVLQRALQASVTEHAETSQDQSSNDLLLGAVDSGFVVLVGFGSEDTLALTESRQWQALIDKVLGLRVFPDAAGKMNLSLEEYATAHSAMATCETDNSESDTVQPTNCTGSTGSTGRTGILLISQFTLYADCRRGRRPSFTPAAPPAVAEELYNRLVAAFRERLGDRLQCGRFGADMRVSFTNWGPVTILLDSQGYADY